MSSKNSKVPSPNKDEYDDDDDEVDSLWRRSPSPAESFGEDADGEWLVEIVSAEVGYGGELRYEAKWPTWRRKDGTNSTWHRAEDVNLEQKIQKFEAEHCKQRHDETASSTAIKLWGTTDLHNSKTRLRNQAFMEKFKDTETDRSKSFPQIMREILAQKQTTPNTIKISRSSTSSRPVRNVPHALNLNRASSSRARGDIPSRSTFSSRMPVTPIGKTNQQLPWTPSSRNREMSVMSTLSSTTAVSTLTTTTLTSSRTPSRSEKSRGKERATEFVPLSPEIEMVTLPPLPARPIKGLPRRTKSRRREKLAEEWSEAARKQVDGAAGISFVNDIDDEDVPPGLTGFKYLEGNYVAGSGVQLISEDDLEGFLVGCGCKLRCKKPEACHCQEDSDITDKNHKTFGYDSCKFLLVDVVRKGGLVIECNTNCACTDDCRNRVAQLPRQLPIEVFKTPSCGWGVRSPASVHKGQVVGLYTGALIHREEASKLKAKEVTYCFDLDGNEVRGQESEQDTQITRYTVNAKQCGNWTRFLNHSCSPNLAVYQVIWDSLPIMNMPYNAFVATEDIPPSTEFTFDYSPPRFEGLEQQKTSDGSICKCGAANCRGWYPAVSI